MSDLTISCRIEEVPMVAGLIHKSFIRDQPLMLEFSQRFNEEYLKQYEAYWQAVSELLFQTTLSVETRMIKQRLAAHYNIARNFINKIEFYVKKAENELSVKAIDFGFKKLRKKISIKDDEAIIRGLRNIQNHLLANQVPLHTKGLTPEMLREFISFSGKFEQERLYLNRKLRERADLIQRNAGNINTLWGMVMEICDAGQIIAREKKIKSMKYDYLISALLKKIRTQVHEPHQEPDGFPVRSLISIDQ